MRISDSLIDSLKGNSPTAWMETLDLEDSEAVTAAMQDVADWLEAGRRSGAK